MPGAVKMTPFETAARAAVRTRLVPATRQNYARALDRWLAHCAEYGVDPSAPPDDAASAFSEVLALTVVRDGEKMKKATIRNHLAALSFIYGRIAAQRDPLISWNPFSSRVIDWPASPREGKTEPVTETDVKRVLSACADGTPRGLRDLALLMVLYETGLRRMSIIALRRDRIYRYEDRVEARVEIKGFDGDDSDRVILPPASVAAIDAWLAVAPPGRYVFPSRDGRSAMDRSMANKILEARAKLAGGLIIHPHRFRVRFITDAFDAGLNQRDIQASVHHEDPRSTQRYDRGQRGIGVTAAVAKHRKSS